MDREAERTGVRLIKVPELQRAPSPLRDGVALGKLIRFFRVFKPHVVATHMSKAGALGRIAATMSGVPVIVHTFHGKGFHVFDRRWKEVVVLGLERSLARLTTGAVVVSTKQRDEFLDLRLFPAERLQVVKYGLDLEAFIPSAARPSTFRADLGIGPDDILIGVIARVVAIKGQDVFLHAASRLALADQRLQFVIVGDGDQRAQFESLAARLQLDRRVHFTGWRRDIPDVLAALDIVVLPTVRDFEGTPLAVIEAMASGRPVVATDVGGVSEVVRHRDTGILVPPGDDVRLAEAIAQLAADASLRERLSQAGREFVVRNYGRERMVDETESYFTSLLSKTAGARPQEASAR